MLTRLTIENYAIIENLDITFEAGLNTITGQTGAGKSILLGALGLLSGNKGDVSTLLDAQKNCVIEGVFEVSQYGLGGFLEQNDIDVADSLTIRRVINTSGKSRAFVNDQPVTLGLLKELSEKLIDIHSQHQSLLISHQDFQIRILDSIAGQLAFVDDYRLAFSELRAKEKGLQKLRVQVAEDAKRRELLQFYIEEIEQVNVQVGESVVLEEELAMLTHAGEIAENVAVAHSMTDDPEAGILMLMHKSLQHLNSVKRHYQPLEEVIERLNSCYIEMKDVAAECFDIAERMEINPARKEQIEERLDGINGLLHKHHIETEEKLVALKDKFDEELWQLTLSDNQIEKLEQEIAQLEKRVSEMARKISDKRRGVVSKVEKHTTSMMKSLGIKDALFQIFVSECEMNTSGVDSVKFLFSANAVSQPQPIEKVASGGEISRLMLALKGLVSKSINLPTVIFDEIDTGVSGLIADKMGEIISEMGENMQVINITHLPQVASKGKHHYFVYKDRGTHIKKLTDQERVMQIAEMLSGANITDAAITQARELLSR